MYKRTIDFSIANTETCFLWGPRQTGKSTLLQTRYPHATLYDLLLSSDYRRFLQNPGLLREECEAIRLTSKSQTEPILIDEIQKLPELIDEVHWLITNRKFRFILSGFSARKRKRNHGNLLGGRAVKLALFPLTYHEIPDFELERALNNGLLPRHYESKHPRRLLQAYVGDYLREEIFAESLVRNLPAFQRFLDIASLSNGQIIVATSIAREVGVSAPSIRSYFEILTDTLLGAWVPAFQKRTKRRVIESPRFYFFDVGVVNELARRSHLQPGSFEFGASFEHFLFMELRAHASYSGLHYPIAYWRTASGFEVDFILGDGQIAIEAKSTDYPTSDHLKGLRALKEEIKPERAILVCRIPRPRKTPDGIEILPWNAFLEELWQNQLISK